MFRKLSLLLLALSAAGAMYADVVMTLEFPRRTFLRYEPVVASLVMRNTSGQTLIFGGEAEFKGTLEIELEDASGHPLRGSGTKVDMRGMILRAGMDQRIRINLSRWVNLRQVGIYRVKLVIAHPMLANQYESNACDFEVSSGSVFWTRRFGVPHLGEKQDDLAPKLRSYTLRGLQNMERLDFFLIVEDEENIYAMKRIARGLGRERPQCDIDSLNRMHILMPLTPKVFQYQVFDWNGQREINKIYKTASTTPGLFRDATTGDVRVVGGEQAQVGVDYTEEKLLPEEQKVTLDDPAPPPTAEPVRPGKVR